MTTHHISTVTQNGMTTSQPGTSVSTTTFNGVCILHVSRHYNLVNSWGGIGRIHQLDSDDTNFVNSEDANKFALDRGYLRRWFAREYYFNALKAANNTWKRGEYKGRRKLTQYLVRVVQQHHANNTWSSVMYKYDAKWS